MTDSTLSRLVSNWYSAPEEEEYEPTICPFCGAKDPEGFYRNKDGEIVGCEDCLSFVFTEDVADEIREM